MLANPIDVKESQSVVIILEIKELELQSKKSSIKVINELIKKINVDINNLSIIFISVPNSFNAFINFEFEKAGISEKLDRNIAVANAEKDREADIMSVKLLIFEGLILNTPPRQNCCNSNYKHNFISLHSSFLHCVFPHFQCEIF